MTPGDGRPWLAAALLLLQVPGCWSLRGPTSVTGTVGGSVRVQCQYEEEFKEIPKYWCKNPCVRKMVKTKGADREVRKGLVSIRDHPAHLTFTVTLENLKEDDAGTYQCGIDTSVLQGYFRDRTFPVLVSVDPASTATLSFSWLTNFPEFYVTLPALTWSTTPPQESASSSQHPGSLLGSVHFLLLILLKVPLFLMMLSAVLWVNRPQWAICGHQRQPDEDNLQPSLPIDILPRDTTTQTKRGRTSGPRPVSSPIIAKNW